MKYPRLVTFMLGVALAFSPHVFAEGDPYFHFHDYAQDGTSTPKQDNPQPVAVPVSNPPPINNPPSTDPKNIAPAPDMAPAPAPQMRVESNLRPFDGLGTSVTLYGGATPLQEGTLRITSPATPGAEIKAGTRDVIGGVAGIKMGYTWSGFDAIAASSDSTALAAPSLIEPCISADFFWTGYRYKAMGSGTTGSNGITGTYDGTLRADVDTYTLCVEPTVKFNLGAFRPYLGFGVGGTYVDASHANVSGNAAVLNIAAMGGLDLTGSSSDVDFTAEGLAGIEFFLSQHWALNLDYKFVYFLSPTFHGDIPGSIIDYHLSGLGEHLFTGGISFYF